VNRSPYFRMYLIGGGALVLVAVVAVTLALVLRPAPLTGDAEADAACNALASAAIDDSGQTSGAKLATLTEDERNAIIREVMEHDERSTIEEIRRAGIALGATNAVGPIPLLGGNRLHDGVRPVRRRLRPARLDAAGRGADPRVAPGHEQASRHPSPRETGASLSCPPSAARCATARPVAGLGRHDADPAANSVRTGEGS
jgi:hypothetical protein